MQSNSQSLPPFKGIHEWAGIRSISLSPSFLSFLSSSTHLSPLFFSYILSKISYSWYIFLLTGLIAWVTSTRPTIVGTKNYINPNGQESDDLACFESVLSRFGIVTYVSVVFSFPYFFPSLSSHYLYLTCTSNTHEYSGQRTQQKALLSSFRFDVIKGSEGLLTR